jgi:taurine transport system permease protein
LSIAAVPVLDAHSAPRPSAPRASFTVQGKRALPISAASTACILALWYLATRWGLASPLFLPSPGEVLTQFRLVATEGYAGDTLWGHLEVSLLRVTTALAIATTTAVPLGLAMGSSRWIKGIFDPPLEFYWPLPPLAYLPLMIIWFGIGETAKILLLTMAIFAPVCFAAQAGVCSVPPERVHAALSLGASRRQVFVHIIAPTALPEILTGLRIGIGSGWSTLVAAELVAATKGIGYMIMSAAQFLATDVVFVGIATIAACAFAFAAAVRVLERRLVPWKGRS